MNAASPILSLSRVRVRYRSRRGMNWQTHEAVRGVSLDVARGEGHGLGAHRRTPGHPYTRDLLASIPHHIEVAQILF